MDSISIIDTSKPREERDFRDFYPDIDVQKHLKVFVIPDTASDSEEERVANDFGKRPNELKKPSFIKRPKPTDASNNIHITKQLSSYGFQHPGKATTQRRADHNGIVTYSRPFTLNSNETIQSKILQKQQQVEYDMDEQDQLFLADRNEKEENHFKITPEVFEIIITLLENQWAKLEAQMNSNSSLADDVGNQLLTLDDYSSDEKYGNDDGITNDSFMEQKCAVCNDSDCDNSNAIVFCDGCNIGVHQECYGIAFIPEGQWLCRKCMINQNNRSIECCFCPSKTGAFKQLDNSLWGHVLCALWINELYFANPIYMEPIEGIELIPKSRWKLVCYICKQRKGACVQCLNKNCFQAYHVTCAKRAGLYMNMTKGIQGAVLNKLSLESYCDRHAPSFWNQQEVLVGIKKTRAYFHDLRILQDQNAQLTSKQKTANKLNSFKWKTESNTPIAPKRFSDIVFNTLISLKLDESGYEATKALRGLGNKPVLSKQQVWQQLRDISNDLCKYWCLKREYKNGAPLIRKNNNLISMSSILYGDYSNEEEISEKLGFSELICKDLDRIIELSNLNMQRQQLQYSANEDDKEILEYAYYPMKKLIDTSLEAASKHDTNKQIIHYKPKGSASSDAPAFTLGSILHKNENYQYSTVKEFEKDIEGFYQQILLENKTSASIVKSSKKWYREIKKSIDSLKVIEVQIQQESASNRSIHAPHITIGGSKVGFKRKNLKQILDEFELEEINYESEVTGKSSGFSKVVPEIEEEAFQKFLKGTDKNLKP